MVDFFRARTLSRDRDNEQRSLGGERPCISAPTCGRRSPVLIGLVAVAFGYPWADSARAIVVALVICVAGWRSGRRTIDTLTDTHRPAPPTKVTPDRFEHPGCGRGGTGARAAGWRHVVRRSQCGGTEPHAATRPRQNHQRPRSKVLCHAEFPKAETASQYRARALDDETGTGARHGHRAQPSTPRPCIVTVQSIAGKLSVSLDLELDGNLSLGHAARWCALERGATNLGPDVEELRFTSKAPATERPRGHRRACGTCRGSARDAWNLPQELRDSCAATCTRSACARRRRDREFPRMPIPTPVSVHGKVDPNSGTPATAALSVDKTGDRTRRAARVTRIRANRDARWLRPLRLAKNLAKALRFRGDQSVRNSVGD